MKSAKRGGIAKNQRPDSQDKDDPVNGSSVHLCLLHGQNDSHTAHMSH